MTTVRDNARLHPKTVTESNKHLKKKSRKKSSTRAKTTLEIKVDRRVLATAKSAMRSGEKMKIISDTEVWLVPK